MSLISQINFNIIDDCLKGKKCNNCLTCQADKNSWKKLEDDFATERIDYSEDLQTYLLVKGKRRIFEQETKGEMLALSEAEAIHMFSRY
jgi:hypothetical protein